MCTHHVSSDGFSAYLALEYINNYLEKNEKNDVPRLSYQEYVFKEVTYKDTKRYMADKKFWNKQFLLNPICSVFSEESYSVNYEAKEVNCSFSLSLYNKIFDFCKTNKISTQSFFNTVYSLYIHKIKGLDLFTIGVPVLNRTTTTEFNSGGLYMHIVPLLIKVLDGSFLTNINGVEDAQINLFRHQKFTQYDIKEL